MADIAVSTRSRSGAFSFPWVFGPRADLGLILGGMSAALALFLMYPLLGWNMLLVWFIWVMLLDTPHFFATYNRTYLDAESRRSERRLLTRSLLVFTVGPAVILLCYALYRFGVPAFKSPWTIYIALVSLWAYTHITRQHYGFLRLYNRKNGEIGTTEAKIDRAALYGCLGLSLVALLVSHPGTRRRAGLAEWSLGPIQALDVWLYWTALAGFLALVGAIVVVQVGRYLRAEPINLPKQLFLGSVIGLHGIVCFSGLLTPNSLLPFTAIITIYHDIQYLFITRFHGRNRYGTTPESRRPFGIAGRLAGNFPLFMAVAILFFAVPVWSVGCLIERVQVCRAGPQPGFETFMGDTIWIVIFAVVTSGLQMHHYLLDQYIWRTGRSAQLRKELKLES
jgi:hypothetical protein